MITGLRRQYWEADCRPRSTGAPQPGRGHKSGERESRSSSSREHWHQSGRAHSSTTRPFGTNRRDRLEQESSVASLFWFPQRDDEPQSPFACGIPSPKILHAGSASLPLSRIGVHLEPSSIDHPACCLPSWKQRYPYVPLVLELAGPPQTQSRLHGTVRSLPRVECISSCYLPPAVPMAAIDAVHAR